MMPPRLRRNVLLERQERLGKGRVAGSRLDLLPLPARDTTDAPNL